MLIFCAAGALRLARLGERPLHGDEAIHALKFLELREHNDYRYDPYEYHGPTLNYFTLVWGGGSGEVDDASLRVTPAVFGLMLLAGVWLLRDGLTGRAAVLGVLLMALSPALSYYSRYYIQETLLVCFTYLAIGFVWQYGRRFEGVYLLLAGCAAGLAFATKETSVISFFCAGLALFAVKGRRGFRRVKGGHLFGAGVVFVLTAGLFFSSFGANPGGIIDSVLTFTTYFGRAGESSVHGHPWYYYLWYYLWFQAKGGVVHSELVIAGPGLAGVFWALLGGRPRGTDAKLFRFLAVFSSLLIIFYSVLPYKTPWSFITVIPAWAILAGIGLDALVSSARAGYRRTLMVLIGAGVIWLGYQAYDVNYISHSEVSNPWVYAHPTRDVFLMAERVRAAAEAADGETVWFYCAGHDYWPIPWYLRDLGNVGYTDDIENVPAGGVAVITFAKSKNEVIGRLYDLPAGEKSLYVPLFESEVYLRPGLEMIGLVRKDIRDRMEAGQ